MRIAVFGATGRTGRQVIEQGLARGHEITAFVRDAARTEHAPERLRVVEGDARDEDAALRAVERRAAAISVLSLTSAYREPELSDATRSVIEAARRAGVRRMILTANNDVFSDAQVTGEFAAHAREHRRNRDALKVSGLDWTIGAAPWVTDDPPAGFYESVIDAKAPGRRLSAADFATFALDALERDDWIGHIVGVSGGPMTPVHPSVEAGTPGSAG